MVLLDGAKTGLPEITPWQGRNPLRLPDQRPGHAKDLPTEARILRYYRRAVSLDHALPVSKMPFSPIYPRQKVGMRVPRNQKLIFTRPLHPGSLRERDDTFVTGTWPELSTHRFSWHGTQLAETTRYNLEKARKH